MYHDTATLQFAQKTATAFDFACATIDRLYWLDEHYVQPFYAWIAPRLRDVAISGLYWALVTLIDVSLWLIDTTLQYMDRDADLIALSAFAQAHAPLPEFPALPPAAVPLVLPSMLLPMAPAPEALDDVPPVLALYPVVGPIAFNSFVPDCLILITSAGSDTNFGTP